MSTKRINFPTMKKSRRDVWIKELRSGKWKQARAMLVSSETNKEDRFCCLGIACIAKNTIQKKKIVDVIKYDDHGILNKKMASWLGIDLEFQERLVYLNDDLGWSFNKIAAYLERYVPTVD